MTSACDHCPRPGDCCREFNLSGADGATTFWKSEGIGGPLSMLARNGWPFLPIGACAEWAGDNGRMYQEFRYRCTNLDDRGRCSDYENRPQLCRDFAPTSDRLCVLHHSRLLGHRP